MSVKERLHEIVDAMSDVEAELLLADLEWEPGPLTEEDRAAIDLGRAQARQGRSRATEEVFERLRLRV